MRAYHRSTRTRRVAGALGYSLSALLLATIAAGCGSNRPATNARPSTVPATTSAPAPAPPATSAAGATSGRTAPSATTTARATSGVPAAALRPSPEAGARTIAGSGDEALGTISLPSARLLVWQTQQAPIQVFTSSGFMLVNSHAMTGSVRLAAGTYRGVRVASRAGWTLLLRTHLRSTR